MTPQQAEILDILDDHRPHCSFEFRERLFMVDYRKRLSELRRAGYALKATSCRGRCGRKHKAAPKLWQLSPPELESLTEVKHFPIEFLTSPSLNGESTKH